jgi:serine/threonine-protein kinase
MLVSWTRLLAGDWRDSLVGRDVLVGCAAGVATSGLFHLAVLAPTWFGRPEASLLVPELGEFSGSAPAVLRLCMIAVFGIVANLTLFLLLVLFRGLLRNEVAAAAAWILFFGFVVLGGIQQTGRLEALLIAAPFAIAVAAVVFFMLTRIGWLAFVAGRVASDILISVPLTFQPSAWYASLGHAMLVVLAAIVLYGFRTSLGSRPFAHLADH